MSEVESASDDAAQLKSMGYEQELRRRMSAFSNFAISMSIICILAGGVTSFAEGFCRIGGAAIGVGWPIVCLFSLTVALTMGQVASAFPTAGGLYHWAAILGGRGWGWITAWFNLVGLIAVLAAINVGTVEFVAGFHGVQLTFEQRLIAFAVVTFSQAFLNQRGIRTTTILTDFSGYWILIVSTLLTLLLIVFANDFQFSRLITFTNYSGEAGGNILPRTESIAWLFVLALLLPAYTITGFDASAHVAEETVGAAVHVPRAIVRAVLFSGLFGWVMLCAVVLAMPNMDSAAAQGSNAFVWSVRGALPTPLPSIMFYAIAVAQYLCGLATVTSASRMTYAFARDGGLPLSSLWKRVSPSHQVPSFAIWLIAFVSVALVAFAPYSAVAAAAAVLLYISYVLPTALGAWTYGRSWTQMGPWNLGFWYRPLSVIAVVGSVGLMIIGVQPPNDKALYIVGGMSALLFVAWWSCVRRQFKGPPSELLAKISASRTKSE